MKVILLEQPGSPVLKIVETNARMSIISWTIDYTGNLPITGYEIQYKKIFLTSKQQLEYSNNKVNQSLINQADLNINSLKNLTDLDLMIKKLRKEQDIDEFWNQANVQFVSSTEVQETTNNIQSSLSNQKLSPQLVGQFNLNKLEPSNLYLIKLRAQNQHGYSKFSNTIFVLTKKESPSLIPQNLTCTSLNSRSIRVSWQIPKSLSSFLLDKKQTSQNSMGQHISHQLIEGSFEFLIEHFLC